MNRDTISSMLTRGAALFGASLTAFAAFSIGCAQGMTCGAAGNCVSSGINEGGATFDAHVPGTDGLDGAADGVGTADGTGTTDAGDPGLAIGLVAYWKFDDGSGTIASDASGSNRGVLLVDGPTWTDGWLGSAVHFDGVQAYGETGYSAALRHWSVSTWVWGDAVPGSTKDAGPVMKEQNFLVSWDHTAAPFRGAAGVSVGGVWYPASFGTLNPNTWYHLVATYDGETLRAYRDGVLITSNGDPSGDADSDSTVTLKIGRHAVQAEFFAGLVDETRIYDRALSDAEVAELYTGRAF